MEVYGLTSDRTHIPKFGTQFENITFQQAPSHLQHNTDQKNPWYSNNIIW